MYFYDNNILLFQVPEIYNAMCLLQSLDLFFVKHPNRERRLQSQIKENVSEKMFNTMRMKIKPLWETRWVE